MKKQPRALQNDPLSVVRCRRLLRPLVSKIHALKAASIAYSSLLDVDLPIESLEGAFPRSKTAPVDQRESFLSNKRRKTDHDDDYNTVLVVEDDDKPPRSDPVPLDAFIRPKTAQERLDSLRPYISSDLHTAYADIYAAFRTVVLSVVSSMDPQPKVPKLASLSALKVGKTIALSHKSTYYKLSQAVLFDEKTLPPHLKTFLDLLDDDIDGWLDLEPHAVSHTYRCELLLGYVVHLLVFNLGLTLFLLIPVLVHWLLEELTSTKSGPLRALLGTLFAEFWRFSPSYFEKNDTEAPAALHGGVLLHDYGTTLFWTLQECGYWKQMVRKLSLKAAANCDNFEGLMLEAMAEPYKIQPSFEDNLTELEFHPMLQNQVYPLLKNRVQHPKANDVLVHLVTYLAISIQQRMRASKGPSEAPKCMHQCNEDISTFIRVWLSFSSGDENSTVFNTLYPGNDEIFLALAKSAKFLLKKCRKASEQLESDDYSTHNNSVRELTTLYRRTELLLVVIEVLQAYYLEEPTFPSLGAYDVQKVGETLLHLQEHATAASGRSGEFNGFLFWLSEQNETAAKELARVCFRSYYGTQSWFHDAELEDVYCVLFEGDE